MSRLGTAAVVAAVVAIALVAALDALRAREAAPVPREPPAARPPDDARGERAVGELRVAGVRGVLMYSDERCRLHAVRLPTLDRVQAPTFEICEPYIPTRGIAVWRGAVVWSGLGYGTVQVVLSRREVSRAVAGGGDARAYRARQAVPLAGGRYAVLAVGPLGDRALAFFAGRRVVSVKPRWRIGDGALRPSPRGTYVAVLDSGGSGLRLFAADGRELPLPALTTPRTIAWSPDERWTAVATPASVYVFRSGRPTGRLLRLPLAVRDLDWAA